jgi:hypothetical protein
MIVIGVDYHSSFQQIAFMDRKLLSAVKGS